MALILFGDPDMVALVATECSSFVHMNSGTSKRSQWMPDGDPTVCSVLRANGLAARTCCLLLLINLLQMTFLLEQPGSSVLMLTCRMEWLIKTMKDFGITTYRQAFWMACWGHQNPKRTVLWSNNPAVVVFTTPKIARTPIKGPPTVNRYVSKRSGKSGYSGSRYLKKTEHLDLNLLIVFSLIKIDVWTLYAPNL